MYRLHQIIEKGEASKFDRWNVKKIKELTYELLLNENDFWAKEGKKCCFRENQIPHQILVLFIQDKI